jgi:hypothetical protein
LWEEVRRNDRVRKEITKDVKEEETGKNVECEMRKYNNCHVSDL